MNARDIADRSTRPALVTDGENLVLHANRRAAEFLDQKTRELIGENLLDLLEARDIFGNRLSPQPIALEEMVRQGEGVERFEIVAMKSDGRPQHVSVSVIVVVGSQEGEDEFVYLLSRRQRRRRADAAIQYILANPSLATEARRSAEESERGGDLTPREIEVLRLLSEGLSVHEIGDELCIAESTVRTHVHHILEKLDVHRQAEAVSRAIREGLI